MKRLKCTFLIGVLFVLITGTLSHFIYDWTGRNAVAGLFTPVNESVWEHMKLLFFPMLLYSLFLIFRFNEAYPCMISSLCFGLLAGTLCIPALYGLATILRRFKSLKFRISGQVYTSAPRGCPLQNSC